MIRRGPREVSAIVWVLLFVACVTLPAAGNVVVIHPNHDNTIYSEGDNSNGAGTVLFSGVTANTGDTRRALMSFDIAGNVPAGATITSVSLGMTQTKISAAQLAQFDLRPVTAAWGEGSSSGIGKGAPPTTTDATWNYRLFSTDLWSTPGGDYGAISGSTMIDTPLGLYTFASQPGLVADVQRWLNTPATNFGWLLRANDENPISAREFASREASSGQPSLTINFSVPEPGPGIALVAVTLVVCGFRPRARRVLAVIPRSAP